MMGRGRGWVQHNRGFGRETRENGFLAEIGRMGAYMVMDWQGFEGLDAVACAMARW
jgi:hypothetical protein